MITNQLTEQEAGVLNVLESLDDHQRIKGERLRQIVRIKNRDLFAVINSLREKGFPVGAGKGKDNSGYYEIRSEKELIEWHGLSVKGATREINAANTVLREWYKNNQDKKK